MVTKTQNRPYSANSKRDRPNNLPRATTESPPSPPCSPPTSNTHKDHDSAPLPEATPTAPLNLSAPSQHKTAEAPYSPAQNMGQIADLRPAVDECPGSKRAFQSLPSTPPLPGSCRARSPLESPRSDGK